MLDWDSLINTPASAQPGGNGAGTTETGTKCPSVSRQNRPVSHPERDTSKPVMARLTDDLPPSVPVVPLEKQGRGKETEKEDGRAGGAAVEPQDFCADVDDDKATYPAHPAAVLLLMTWARLKKISSDGRAELLIDLEGVPPAEQIRHWHGVCVQDGMKPWHVLCLPAPLSGADCTRCRNLCTRHEAIEDGRVQYHWACELGYLILEQGRGTERILIAPPECKSFERWYPSDQR